MFFFKRKKTTDALLKELAVIMSQFPSMVDDLYTKKYSESINADILMMNVDAVKKTIVSLNNALLAEVDKFYRKNALNILELPTASSQMILYMRESIYELAMNAVKDYVEDVVHELMSEKEDALNTVEFYQRRNKKDQIN